MFAYILTDTITYYGAINSTTAVFYSNNSTPIFYDDIQPDNELINIMPWLFDFYEPWKSPVYYQPAPKKMLPKRISVTDSKPLVLKQPIARAGFRRGQRRIKKYTGK